jgi:hypothetical protein
MPRQWTTAVHHSMTSNAALDTGSPGGEQARSNTTRLQNSFPGSPMLGPVAADAYNEAAVSKLKFGLVTNTIGSTPAIEDDVEPRAQSQTYWGLSTPEDADLNYSAVGYAPDLDAAPPADDAAGKPVASYLGPNLNVPPINNPTNVVIDDKHPAVLPDLTSFPPFVGNGRANPRATSTIHKEELVDVFQGDENGLPLVAGGPHKVGEPAGDVGA